MDKSAVVAEASRPASKGNWSSSPSSHSHVGGGKGGWRRKLSSPFPREAFSFASPFQSGCCPTPTPLLKSQEPHLQKMSECPWARPPPEAAAVRPGRSLPAAGPEPASHPPTRALQSPEGGSSPPTPPWNPGSSRTEAAETGQEPKRQERPQKDWEGGTGALRLKMAVVGASPGRAGAPACQPHPASSLTWEGIPGCPTPTAQWPL